MISQPYSNDRSIEKPVDLLDINGASIPILNKELSLGVIEVENSFLKYSDSSHHLEFMKNGKYRIELDLKTAFSFSGLTAINHDVGFGLYRKDGSPVSEIKYRKGNGTYVSRLVNSFSAQAPIAIEGDWFSRNDIPAASFGNTGATGAGSGSFKTRLFKSAVINASVDDYLVMKLISSNPLSNSSIKISMNGVIKVLKLS